MRWGLGLGIHDLLGDPHEFATVVDAAERTGVDSLWLSERVAGPTLDPLTALAFAAARTSRLKLGTSVLVVPGRNPVLLAKQLATVDVLSGGRLLPAFGLGTLDPVEHMAFGVAPEDRGAWFDEAVPLIRRLWREPVVDHESKRFPLHGVSVHPKPVGRMEIWTGGRTAVEYRRAGRLSQGWLGSFQTVAEAAAARTAISAAAAEAGRAIDDDHYGMLLLYARAELPSRIVDLVHSKRPELSTGEVAPVGGRALVELVQRYVGVGITKFVAVPAGPPSDWQDELEWLGATLSAAA